MLKRVGCRCADKQEGASKPDRNAVIRLCVLVAVTAVVFGVYRSLLRFYYFELVLMGYIVLSAAFLIAYVIYNRGFSRKGVTSEMLPEEWSEEEKKEFLEDGARRLKKSRWMLIPIFAFLFTFAYDVMELFVIPFFTDLLLK